MTDTTQNKPTCCEKCSMESVRFGYGCQNVSCDCHIRLATQTTPSCACDCHPKNTTKGKRYICEHCDKTTPSEEWVSEYYDLCRELKYHDLVPRVRMKEFIEKIRAAAYQQGRLDEGEVCGYDQGYEKGYEEGVRHGEGTGNGVQRYQMGYKEGHKDGIAEEAVGCDEHCKASYEKGVRDSLEAVEIIESDPPSESIEETLAFQKACNESIEAISTLLK